MSEVEGDVRPAEPAECPDVQQEAHGIDELASLVHELANLGFLARDSDNGCEGTQQPPEDAKSDEVYTPRSIVYTSCDIIEAPAIRAVHPRPLTYHPPYSQHTIWHLHSEFTNSQIPPPSHPAHRCRVHVQFLTASIWKA